MKKFVRNVLAVMAGLLIGSTVNITLINMGASVIPLPDGADVSSMESLRDSMDEFTPANFIFPFLGHALGTLVGAFAAAKIALSHPIRYAVGIGVVFLIGGISAAAMIGGPLWFNMVDLVLAYIPMGYLGGILACRKKKVRPLPPLKI